MAISDPSDIAGLYISLRSDTGITLSGSDITLWEDQSTNGYDLTPTGGANITLTTGGGPMSNIPVINFAGGYLVNTGVSLPAAADPIQFTMVFALYTPSSSGEMWRSFDGVTSSGLNTVFTTFGTPPNHYLNGQRVGAGSDWVLSSIQGTGWTDDTWTVITLVFDGAATDAFIYANGSLIGTDTTNYNGSAEV